MKVIDVSVPLFEHSITWPGINDTRARYYQRGSYLETNVHTGTHIDAPSHVLKDGKTVDQLDLQVMDGMGYVADVCNVPLITAQVLSSIPHLPIKIRRLLLKTDNSEFWGTGEFNENFVGLSTCAAKWIVDRGIQLIGIDYLSIEPYDSGNEVHRILLTNDVIILEGLNLSKVAASMYHITCLPLPLVGLEGAPARVVVKPW